MFFKQIIWDTMKECDLLEKCKKIALPRCISSNLPSRKNIQKKIIYISHFQRIKNNFSFCFWTFQPQNVINLLLVKIKVCIFFVFFCCCLFFLFVCLFFADKWFEDGRVRFSYILLINYTPWLYLKIIYLPEKI